MSVTPRRSEVVCRGVNVVGTVGERWTGRKWGRGSGKRVVGVGDAFSAPPSLFRHVTTVNLLVSGLLAQFRVRELFPDTEF